MHRRTTFTTESGSAESSPIGNDALLCCCKIAITDVPRNGGWPDKSANNVAPSE